MFWNRFYDLCIANKTTPNAVCKAINLSNATATYWKNGTMPKGDVLSDIADYFNCSVDYLLGRTDNINVNQSNNNGNIVNGNNGNFSPLTVNSNNKTQQDTIKQNFINLFDNLSPENQIEVMYFTKQLTKKEELTNE